MVARKLRPVRRVVLVMSGKGGVGKSVVSATLAALLARDGHAVGLMDADIYGPSSALLLGAKGLPQEGRKGLFPLDVGGVKVMSVDLFAPGMPVPLTGRGATQVITEMLALTHWGGLDYLVVDMPPATGDIMLALTSVRPRGVSALVVTMPDRLSIPVAGRVLQLLKTGGIPVVGVVGNMNRAGQARRRAMGGAPARLAAMFHVKFLGSLGDDPGVRDAVEAGSATALLSTRFAGELDAHVKSALETGRAKRRKE